MSVMVGRWGVKEVMGAAVVPSRHEHDVAAKHLQRVVTSIRTTVSRSLAPDRRGTAERIVTAVLVEVRMETRRAVLAGHPLRTATRERIVQAVRSLRDLGTPPETLARVTRRAMLLVAREISQLTPRRDDGWCPPTHLTESFFAAAHDILYEVVTARSGPSGRPTRPPELSNLEREILRGLARGLSSAEIACRMYYSRQAVSYHLGRLMSRCQVPNRTALVAFAYENAWLSPVGWDTEMSDPQLGSR